MYPAGEIALAVVLAASFATHAWAARPELRRVAAPPPLTPLAMAAGGRVLTTPARADSSTGGLDYAAQWPGSYFQANFKGTELYFRVGPAHEILHVAVDGRAPLGLVDPPAGIYRLSGLDDTAHSVTVRVVTESQLQPNHFGGFGIPLGETALPPTRHPRQIEFIGDSHTVGYGNTSSTHTCTEDEVWATTDDSQAFGPLTAESLDAEFQINAISGCGVVRNYNGSAGDTLPVAYPYVLFDKKQSYVDPSWQPEVIVIALGTNDFTTALNPGERWTTREQLRADFESTYLRFLQSLWAKDPRAYLIVWATGMANGEIESEAQKVVDDLKQRGETRIAFLPINGLSFSGCHFHPSVADDKTIRDRLVQFIDSVPHIWQGPFDLQHTAP